MDTIAIVGDFHGASSDKLEAFLKARHIKKLICLGDFDTVEGILQFKDLEERLTAAGGKVLKVPGNHDHAYLNDFEITSGDMRKLGKNFYQLRAELFANQDAYNYLQELVESPFGVRIHIAEGVSIYIVHGGIAGHIDSDIPAEYKALWYRLPVGFSDNKEQVLDTFNRMEKKDCPEENLDVQLLIRGHDHQPIIRKRTEEGYDSKQPSEITDEGLIIDPSKNPYIINPGAYRGGYLATLEVDPTKSQMTFRFHKV